MENGQLNRPEHIKCDFQSIPKTDAIVQLALSKQINKIVTRNTSAKQLFEMFCVVVLQSNRFHRRQSEMNFAQIHTPIKWHADIWANWQFDLRRFRLLHFKAEPFNRWFSIIAFVIWVLNFLAPAFFMPNLCVWRYFFLCKPFLCDKGLGLVWKKGVVHEIVISIRIYWLSKPVHIAIGSLNRQRNWGYLLLKASSGRSCYVFASYIKFYLAIIPGNWMVITISYYVQWVVSLFANVFTFVWSFEHVYCYDYGIWIGILLSCCWGLIASKKVSFESGTHKSMAPIKTTSEQSRHLIWWNGTNELKIFPFFQKKLAKVNKWKQFK